MHGKKNCCEGRKRFGARNTATGRNVLCSAGRPILLLLSPAGRTPPRISLPTVPTLCTRDGIQVQPRTGRTRVIGTRHEVDDRTRVYRSEEEQRRMEEAWKKQVYERRRVQSRELAEDSTSDQLSEDLPFSGLFGRKKKTDP